MYVKFLLYTPVISKKIVLGIREKNMAQNMKKMVPTSSPYITDSTAGIYVRSFEGIKCS
jgi:hypothetical protein